MPDKNGHFGIFGGRYVPDTLFEALSTLEKAYHKAIKDKAFKKELHDYLTHYVGRPTPLTYAASLSKLLSLNIYLKREDLNHTGAHKINNALAQVLLAKKMGKTRIIAETGAGQHGVATATATALLGLPCDIYMGEEDMQRQSLNVARMRLMGASVIKVDQGSKTLKEATTAAIRDWMQCHQHTHYVIGSALGPHPYPMMVHEFQSVIGKEAKKQLLKKERKWPDAVIACVGGGSNAIGIFSAFLKHRQTRLIAVEAAGHGLNTHQHAASLSKGKPGILHGTLMYLLQDFRGQIGLAHSISAGLDYPGVGPELSHLKDKQRIEIQSATDQEALEACRWMAELEGIIPALETAHAVAILKKNIFKKQDLIVLNLSGRGDKDMMTISQYV